MVEVPDSQNQSWSQLPKGSVGLGWVQGKVILDP